MSLMASQITSLTFVYSTVYSGAYQRTLQSSASLAFVRGIHRGPFDDVIMSLHFHDYTGDNKVGFIPLLSLLDRLPCWVIGRNSAYLLIRHGFNTLRPRQNGRHFPDDIFKWIFLNENVWISIKISLKFVPNVPINNIPALVQIMAWCRSGDKPSSEPMVDSLLTHICVTRSQWVKGPFDIKRLSLGLRPDGVNL